MTWKAALLQYQNIVSALMGPNAHSRTWWYSWLSCRDVFNVRLPHFLEANPIHAVSLSERLAIRIDVMRRLEGELRWEFRWFFWTRKAVRRASDLSDVKVVLVTMLHPRQESTKTAYVDAYFGDLARRLTEAGEKTVVMGQPVGEPTALSQDLTVEGGTPVYSFFSFVTILDFLRAFGLAISARLEIPADSSLSSSALRQRIRQAFSRSRPHIARALMIERALSRLLACAPSARIIHMCENNQWERACVFAARQAIPRRPVYGYVHNPIFRANPKLTSVPDEWTFRPDPDRVITTGESASDALRYLNMYPPAKVVSGCALRLEAASQGPKMDRPGIISTVLVLLSGLLTMVDLVKFLDVAARGLMGVRILLRGHPNRPVSQLTQLAGVSVGHGRPLELSEEPNLEAALNVADCVIYVSSGAVFAAARRGLPLLHVRLDPEADEDPFFMRPDLRREVTRPEDLINAIADFNAMSLDGRRAYSAQLAEYALSYMTPPSQESLHAFASPLFR